MEFLIAILGIICIPIYVLCVAILLTITPVFGSYVDASVYVCEYGEPFFTGTLTLCFLANSCIYAAKAVKYKMYGRATVLIVISLIYLLVIYMSICTIIYRIETYEGMTNKQIFDFVVAKLRHMGSCFDGTVGIMGHEIGFGYIVANFMTYILPISLTLWSGLIQRITSKRLRKQRLSSLPATYKLIHGDTK